MPTNLTPEQKARKIIDSHFSAAGWEVVSRDSYSPIISAAAIEEGLLNHNLEADYLLFKQLERLEKDFLAEGGFTERMYRVRKQQRGF